LTKDNQVVMQSTTMHGYLYHVYHKDDTERKKILYRGEISDIPQHNYCECTGYTIGTYCYHHSLAKQRMGVEITVLA